MKRFFSLVIFILGSTTAFCASPAFSATIGGDFFNYKNAFLDLGTSAVIPIENGLEFNLAFHFAIATKKVGSEVQASFFIPIDVGLNFVFNEDSMINFLVGTGLSPQFIIDDGFNFYMGPYLKGGIRVKVHKYMKWFLEIQQDLIIGAPDWINTSTRFKTGVLFSIGS